MNISYILNISLGWNCEDTTPFLFEAPVPIHCNRRPEASVCFIGSGSVI